MKQTSQTNSLTQKLYIIERMSTYLKSYNLDDLLDLYLNVKENSIKLENTTKK